MEGLKSATNTPTTNDGSSPASSSNTRSNDSKQQQQFASYHPNPNFKFTGKNNGGNNRNNQNKSNNRKPFESANNQQQQQQQKKNKNGDFVNGSNSQNVNPSGSGPSSSNNGQQKKFRPNRRRNHGNNAASNSNSSNNAQLKTEEVNEVMENRLNKSLNKERTPENSFVDENGKSKSIPASISLDNFHIINENGQQQRWSPKGNKNRSPRSPRGAKNDKSNSSMTSSTSHHGFGSASNTIIEHESHEIEIPTTSDHYEVASNDPLAEIFKHATTYVQHEMSLGSLDNVVGAGNGTNESSFYSTPLNHTIPTKYDALLNSTAATSSVVGSGGFASTDATAYFSATERTLSEITMPKLSHDIMISSSSSSSSPEHAGDAKLDRNDSIENDSQALVTASEGESSFGLEPTIENTITNVAIETSFANEIVKSTGENEQKANASGSYMDDLKELSTSMQSAQTVKETDEDMSENTTSTTTHSTTTTTTTTMSFINRHLSTVSTPSSSLAPDEESGSASSASSASSPSPSSSSSTSKGANTSSSSFSVGSDDVAIKKNEAELNVKQSIQNDGDVKQDDDDMTVKTTTSDVNNYSMQINYPSSTASEELSSNDRTSSSSHSSSFNKCDSDEPEIRCDLIDISSKCEGEIRIEVAHLIEKIVLDAITQANKKATTNDSLIEIDINDTLTDERRQTMNQQLQQNEEQVVEKRQSQLIIKPILEQDLVSIDRQQQSVSYAQQQASPLPQQTETIGSSEILSPLKEKQAANTSVAVATPKLDTTNDHINESTASMSSVNMTKLANQKKNPIVDCFSCTIL